MADEQGESPHIGTGDAPSRPETAQAQGASERGVGDTASGAHWCYQCNKEVVVEPEQAGSPGGMICIECRSGFVEALTTAQNVPDVRRAQRRRHRRIVAGANPATGAPRQMVPLSEALEQLYPQQLMHVLQMLGQATNRSNSPAAAGSQDLGSQDPENTGTVEARNAGESQVQDDAATASQASPETLPQPSGDVGVEVRDGSVERPASEDVSETPVATAEEALERLAEEGHMLFITGASPGQDDYADEDLIVSDSESEEGMRLEFDAWSSADEDEGEWEEVDEDEEAVGTVVEDGTPPEDPEPEPQEGGQVGEQRAMERGQPRLREFRMRTRNMEHNLHQYLQELLHNLVGQNVEVRVELPNGPLYVGNPGDYVDARGFEQLLQQMAENDNSRRGAPPAAKTAVDRLPLISIEQRHLDDGSAVCAICKDVVALGQPAKQLPCLHLYHHDCILPWLSSRNSCPVCRYELPTDDPDYEEQKQNRNGSGTNNNPQSPRSGSEVVDGQEGNSSGGGVVQDSPDQQQNSRDGDLGSDSEQILFTAGEDVDNDSALECSLLQGLEDTSRSPRSSNGGGATETREIRNIGEGREALRGTGRGWFLLAAAPVLSMMGLVLVLCLGNHLIGSGIHQLGTPLRRQHHRVLQESHLEHLGGTNEVQGRRRWWMPFQR